jgi:hypothetical protein
MNHETEIRRRIDDSFLDRLVDGELDASERRSLLTALDETPDGWRRCAVAFLEAQAWRSDLRGTLARSPASERPAGGAATGRRSLWNRWRSATAIAAALLVAFAAGWLVRPEHDPGNNHPAIFGVPVAEVREDDRRRAPDGGPERQASDSNSDANAAVRLAGVFKFELDDRGQTRTIEVPVLEGPGVDPRWLLMQPPAIRASAVQALERRGHRVEAHRELLSVNLKDGRELILPVDEIGVRPANRVFQ